MRQVQLGHSDEVGGSTVTGSSLPTRQAQPNGSSYQAAITATSNGGVTPVQPINHHQATGGGNLTPVPLAREGNGSTTPVTIPMPPRRQSQRTYEQSTGINLSGKFEKWGMAPSTQLTTAKIEFTNLTVQQIKQILQKLPSTFKAYLEVSYLEDEQL